MGRTYDDLAKMGKKGLYELGQATRAFNESVYLAPDYNDQSMDERQTSFLEQAQSEIEVPQPQQEQQMEVDQ